jgi:hypothetical protein
VRLEGLGKLKRKSMTLSGNALPNFRLVAYCFNQLCYDSVLLDPRYRRPEIESGAYGYPKGSPTPTVKEEIRRYSSQYSARLSAHPNGLIVNFMELPDNKTPAK